MANPVVVEFILRGMPDIARAMKTVETAAGQSERARERAAVAASKARLRAEEQETKAKIRTMLKADAEQKRAQDRATKEVEKQAKQRVRAAEKEEKDMLRAADKAANEKIRISRQVDRELAAMARKREQENNKLLRESAREQDRIHRESARAQRSRDNKDEHNRSQTRERFKRGIGAGLASGVTAVAGRARETLGMVTQLGGGFSIGDSVQRATANSGQLEDILNSAYNPTSNIKANQRRRDATEVESDIQATSMRYGLQRSEVQSGLGDITGITGDLETSMKLLPQLAEMTRATGGRFDEMAQAAGNVALAFDDVKDSGKKAEMVMSVIRTMAGQGQAVQAAKVVASAGAFAGANNENVMKMGALMQMSRGGGGAWNAGSAATAVTAFTSTFGKEARLGAFEEKGIDVFADKTHTKVRPVEEIIADALEKTGGSREGMAALFGSQAGLRAVNKPVDIFTKAEAEKKGSGRQAFLDEFNKLFKGTAMTKNEIADASSKRTAALDVQMARVQEDFDKAVQEKIIPALLKLVPVIEEMVPMFVDLNARAMPAFVDLIKTVADFAEANKGLISSIAAHPIGAIMAVEVTKSIGSAALGSVVSGLVAAPLTPLAGLAVGLAALVAAVIAAKAAIDAEFKHESDAQDSAVNRQLEAAQLQAKINRGEATPEDIKKANELITGMKGDVREQINIRENPGMAKTASAAAAAILAPEAAKEAADTEERNRQETIRNLNESIKTLATSIEKHGLKVDKNSDATHANTQATGAPTKPGMRPASATTGIVPRATGQ
jgi:hypothetical protein